jgi:CRP/FNR family transcriptional regulator
VLFRQQDASGLFLIEGGLVKLIRTSPNGRSLILSVTGPHQLVGVESLAYRSTVGASDAICLSEVSGYRIPVMAARRFFGKPDHASELLNYLILQDQERIARIERQILYEVEQRILLVLAELSLLVKPGADGAGCLIPLTQVELAGLIGATRETTCTALSSLQERNLVKLARRMMTTVQAGILIDAANGRLAHSQKAE